MTNPASTAYPARMADDNPNLRKVEVRGMPSDLWQRVRVAVAIAAAGSMSAFVVDAIREKLAREERQR